MRNNVASYGSVDSRAMAYMLFKLVRSTKGNYVMACFMVLELCTFQMEANMKENGAMVLHLP